VVMAATLPEDESGLTISHSHQFLKQPRWSISHELMNAAGGDPLEFADHRAKFSRLRRNNHQVNVLRHRDITEQPELVITADLKEAIDDNIFENMVSQHGQFLVGAEGYESRATIVIIVFQLHLATKVS